MPKPTIDPITGKPVANADDPNAAAAAAENVVQIKKEDWDKLNTRLDTFEKNAMNFNQQPAQPAVPAKPAGPTLVDQVQEIDKDIAALNTKIDEAVTGGKPVSQLMTERDTLMHKRTRLQIKYEDIDPAMNAGIQTIDQISAEITRGKMKYYDLVKDDVEAALASLAPDQRMNPQMREAAYNIAVGKNIAKIMEAQEEEMLRSVSDAANNGTPPVGGNSRANDQPGKDTIPEPKDVLSPSALNAIKSVGKTPDEYYKSLGYAGGWNDFWEKRGKSYFGDEEAESEE